MNQELFYRIFLQHGCGYWHVCDDHACGCALSANNMDYNAEIYASMQKQQNEEMERYSREWGHEI